MEIRVREITRKGGSFIFQPNSRGGFKFTEKAALPKLTAFQKSCINIKPSKSRKSNGFWTPDFCFFGAYFSSCQEINLSKLSRKDIANESNFLEAFNGNFPDKKWYWYSKPRSENIAVQMYFLGVRVVSGIVAHYLSLQLAGDIKKANTFYSDILQPIGLVDVLSKIDGTLLSVEDNNQYVVEERNGDYHLVNNLFRSNSTTKESKPYLNNDVPLKDSRKTTSDDYNDVKEPKQVVTVQKVDKPPINEPEDKKIATPKDMRLPSITSKKDDSSSSLDNHEKRGAFSPQRIKLPKRGDL